MANLNVNAVDFQLFQGLKDLLNWESYTYLDGKKEVREKEKAAFLATSIGNPKLDYPELHTESLEGMITQLEIALNGLSTLCSGAVYTAYQAKIEEKLAEVQMLLAASQGRDQQFMLLSRTIFGFPDRELFRFYFTEAYEKAERLLENGNEAERQAASAYLDVLADEGFLMPKLHIALPTQETIQFGYEKLVAPYEKMLAGLPKSGEVNAHEIVQAFEDGLQYLGVVGWLVRLVNNRSGISVNLETNEILVPESRTVGVLKLRQLMLHELMHVARAENGMKSKLQLFGLGFAGYLPGEEGITTCVEQIVAGKVDSYRGFDGYFAIGLACGVDDKPRDFRGTFNILKAYYAMTKAAKLPYDKALEAAADTAWNRCIRTFRGTTCQTKGACFTKDLAYSGNFPMWQYLESVKRMGKELPDVWAGKYNPADPIQVQLAQELGLI